MKTFAFKVEKKVKGELARAGIIETPHGRVLTPAFVAVATKATVKALTPEQVKTTGCQIVLANTYHLYLQPGDKIVKQAGGFAKMMNWPGPTMTDSGGFQVFSLGRKASSSGSKISNPKKGASAGRPAGRGVFPGPGLVALDDKGATFVSPLDGSKHLLTPEKSIAIQRNLGADIIFAFDECPPADAPIKYQREALRRTKIWANKSLAEHKRLKNSSGQSLFGIVQGGRHEDLRRQSARSIGEKGFAGFGIGGSFDKLDIGTAVRWVNDELPEELPRHLLGIGEPEDLVEAIANGCDTFDCVAPTRLGRNGTLYSSEGKINIYNAKFKNDIAPIDRDCNCYTCRSYTKSYLAHLFRAKEMLAATLASIHNLSFIVGLVDKAREAILAGDFGKFQKAFGRSYRSNSGY